MCQLLGMNCAAKTDFSFSFRGFCRRGGATDIHSHGFGVSIYEGRGLRSFLDTLPAATSPVAELVQRYPMRTYNMMAHVRYATQGCVSLENVHPFSREMWGISFCFCHNGEVPKFCHWGEDNPPFLGKVQTSAQIAFRPIGDTDSEAVFCAILNALKAEFDSLPTLPVLHCFLNRLCAEIVEGHPEETIFNFLLGCGQYTMFAYSWPGRRPGSKVWNGLHYIVREPPFSTAKLVDVDYTIDFAAVTTPSDRVAVITTKPLTDEAGWTEFQRGELIMFDQGTPHFGPESCESVELQGRGLYSKCFGKQKRAVAALCAQKTVAAEATTSETTTASENATTNESDTTSSTPSSSSLNGELKVEKATAALQAAAAAAAVACLEAQQQTRQQASTTGTTAESVTESPRRPASKVC